MRKPCLLLILYAVIFNLHSVLLVMMYRNIYFIVFFLRFHNVFFIFVVFFNISFHIFFQFRFDVFLTPFYKLLKKLTDKIRQLQKTRNCFWVSFCAVPDNLTYTFELFFFSLLYPWMNAHFRMKLWQPCNLRVLVVQGIYVISPSTTRNIKTTTGVK